tara:strand:- start:5932 stop:6621 length:690 start_codon:yes stop_codon:yes gene_type:complete
VSGAYGSGLGNLSQTGSRMRSESGGGPGIKFHMEFEPSAESISQFFEKWADEIKDMRPVWSDVVKLFRKHEARHLDSGGEATGKAFVPLSPAYKAWKDRNFPGKPILTLRGALRLALVDGKGSSAFKRETRDSLHVGVLGGEVGVYAAAHAFGQGNLPVRPPVRYDETIKGGGSIGGGKVPLGTAIAQIFQIHIVNARKKAMAAEGIPDVFDEEKMMGRIPGILNLTTT